MARSVDLTTTKAGDLDYSTMALGDCCASSLTFITAVMEMRVTRW
jgi:hypothetical protein